MIPPPSPGAFGPVGCQPAVVRLAHWYRTGAFEEWAGLRETLEDFAQRASQGAPRDPVILCGLHADDETAPHEIRPVLELGVTYCAYVALLDKEELQQAVARALAGTLRPWPLALSAEPLLGRIRQVRHWLDNRLRHVDGMRQALEDGVRLSEAPSFLSPAQEKEIRALQGLGRVGTALAPEAWGVAMDRFEALRKIWGVYRTALAGEDLEASRAENHDVNQALSKLATALDLLSDAVARSSGRHAKALR